MQLKLINCAVASDGGSIALQFKTNEINVLQVTLYNGLDIPAKGKIFTTGNSELPLTTGQEKALQPKLETAKTSSEDCKLLLLDVIAHIRSR